MAFTKVPPKVARKLKELRVELVQRDDGEDMSNYAVVIEFDDNSNATLYGDLLPHLTPAQIGALLGFMHGLWVQAESQLL